MSTSDLPIEEHVAAAQLTKEIERLANELFMADGPAPYAANVGAGGVSPAAAAPGISDVPKPPVSPAEVPAPEVLPFAPPGAPNTAGAPFFLDLGGPLAQTPSTSNMGGGLSPAAAPAESSSSPSPETSSSTPYFLEIAGMPAPSPSGATSQAPPQRPAPAAPAPAAPALAPFATELSPELVPDLGTAPGIFDPHAVKRDFPILEEKIHGKPLVWLDNAATTQKPNAVIDRISHYYRHENSNVHRGAHTLAARATDAYEGARNQVRRFLNAGSSEEIVFVRGATEGINLVAKSWGNRNIEQGDEIVITWLEHHANIVPWQMLCREKGARLRIAPVDSRGQVIVEEYERLFNSRTKLASIPHVSNALGTIVPAKEMVEIAHRWGARVLVDGAQAVSHMPVDVQLLDADFYVFSGHKVFAPTGIGVVYGKKDVLAAMPPWQGGGNMIADVTFEKTTYQPPPWRFEAGTASIADAVGLGAALEYVGGLGLPNIARHEHELRLYGEESLQTVPGLRIIGTAPEKAGVISFVLDGVRTEDVGGLLDAEGIAVRSGHHCAQPILRRFGLEATVRASLAPYNTREDIDALVAAVRRLQLGRPGAVG